MPAAYTKLAEWDRLPVAEISPRRRMIGCRSWVQSNDLHVGSELFTHLSSHCGLGRFGQRMLSACNAPVARIALAVLVSRLRILTAALRSTAKPTRDHDAVPHLARRIDDPHGCGKFAAPILRRIAFVEPFTSGGSAS